MFIPLSIDIDNISRDNCTLVIQKQQLQDAVALNEYLSVDSSKFYGGYDIHLLDLMKKVEEIMQKHNFINNEIAHFVYVIILEATKQDKYNLKITEDADAQIVIYTENEPDNFRNIAIDEDGDVSYMFFAKDKENSERKMYYYEDGIDVRELASLL